MEHAYVVAVTLADRRDHVERVGVQPLGVEGEDLDVQLVPQDGVRDHHVLGRQARCERGRRMFESHANEQVLEFVEFALQGLGHGLPAASRRRKSGVVLRTEVW